MSDHIHQWIENFNRDIKTGTPDNLEKHCTQYSWSAIGEGKNDMFNFCGWLISFGHQMKPTSFEFFGDKGYCFVKIGSDSQEDADEYILLFEHIDEKEFRLSSVTRENQDIEAFIKSAA